MRLTTQQIAVVLGVTESAVRHIVRRSNGKITAKGKRGRAKVYDPHEVIRHAGGHDRRAHLTGRRGVSQ